MHTRPAVGGPRTAELWIAKWAAARRAVGRKPAFSKTPLLFSSGAQ